MTKQLCRQRDTQLQQRDWLERTIKDIYTFGDISDMLRRRIEAQALFLPDNLIVDE